MQGLRLRICTGFDQQAKVLSCIADSKAETFNADAGVIWPEHRIKGSFRRAINANAALGPRLPASRRVRDPTDRAESGDRYTAAYGMSFATHRIPSIRCGWQIRDGHPLPALIGVDESQPAFPWWVGVHQSLPRLRCPGSGY